MEAFLNERSLQAQFSDIAAVSAALTIVNRVLNRVAELEIQKSVFFDGQMYAAFATPRRSFASCIVHIPDKNIRLQFKVLLRDRLGAREWRAERMHEECPYVWNNQDMVTTSVAELAERVFQHRIGLLINFAPSDFASGHCVDVAKASSGIVVLDSINNELDLEEWFRLVPELGVVLFDPGSGRTPLDQETILRKRSRFQRTSIINQGRRVYLDRQSGNFVCVDNQHIYDAHLEVFNSNGDHIGEASLDGVFDASKNDPSKNLYL
jgi:hypothetical protein